MEKSLYDLKVDPDFSIIAPPLKENEKSLLEEDILVNGCIDTLVVWRGTIIDGHSRYEICKKHGIPFSVTEHAFEDKDSAMAWIAINQLARRNLTMFQKCEMVLLLKEQLAAEAKKRMYAGVRASGEKGDVRNLLANLAGVSHGTMGKALWLSMNGDAETLRRVRNGEISIHHAYLSSRQDITRIASSTKDVANEGAPEILLEKPVEKTSLMREKASICDARYLVGELIQEVKQGKTDSKFIVDVLTDVLELLK